jgi:hypothetical protein
MVAAAVVLVAVAIAVAVLLVVAHNATRSRQERSLANDTTRLVRQFDGYESQGAACEKVANPYSCIERADAAMAPHLDDYAREVKGVSGSGISPTVLDRAARDGQSAARAFRVVGGAAHTKAGYVQAVSRSGIFTVVHQFQTSVTALSDRLG